jgi:outer membrane protein assembly factor BamB
MTDRPGMRLVWEHPTAAWDMVAVDGKLVVTRENAIVGLDASGRERWERTFDLQPRHLTRCGRGVAFTLASRWAPTQVIALDLDGNDAWRYDRPWGLFTRGIAGDDRGLVLAGQDYGPVADDHWVGLDANGALVFDIKPLTDASPTIAGRWLLADIDSGNGGVLRVDRDGTHPMTLTSRAHIAQGATDEYAVIIDSSDGDAVAFDLASGQERWRAPGGNILDIPCSEGRAAWVDALRRPVVYELATGRQVWAGAPLPAILEQSRYECVLAPRLLVCIADDAVIYYSLAASEPLLTRDAPGNRPSFAVGINRLLESSDTLTCWEPA